MISSVIVIGSGTAGLMAALALKRHIPHLTVSIVRSTEVGIIGVGESTTPQFCEFLFSYLGLSRKRFYALARPTWKLGINFLWGAHPKFNYTFVPQLDGRYDDLSHPNGYYCTESFDNVNLASALMSQGKAFSAQPNGCPEITGGSAFHLFNPLVVKALETFAEERGISIIEAKVTGHTKNENGVESILTDDNRRFTADFFVDASGFRSELLGRALQTPYLSYDNALFCDRAVLGTWNLSENELLDPYTTVETMDAGWAWKIDHEHATNRGYVYSSRFLSDDAARDEFARKNPKAKIADRVVKYTCGRYAKGWVQNVFGIGNACGFVEPLEATALMVASSQIQTMVDLLKTCQLTPNSSILNFYNTAFAEFWDHIRDFLALHYRFNTRLATPFWHTCQNETDIFPIQPLLDFYTANGPTGFCRHFLNSPIGGKSQFGIEGFLVMLVGMKVPYHPHTFSSSEQSLFIQRCNHNRQQAATALTVNQALRYVHHPEWSWHGDPKT